MAGFFRSALIAVAGLVALLVVSLSSPVDRVAAHADLVEAEPAAGSELSTPPAELTLTFSQGLKQAGSFVLIEDSSGNRVPVQVAFDPADAKVMGVTIGATLAPGVYEVRWQTLSADDDDYHDGSYSLTVLNPDGSKPGEALQASSSDDNGGSDTLILVVVSVVVVLMVGALALYIRKTSRPA